MKTLRTLFSLLLIISSAHAEEPLTTGLTLESALQHGRENHPGLKSAYYQWQSHRENITVQKALPDPAFNYGYYFEPVETRTGPQNQRFTLTQTFPAFGKRSLQKSVATELANISEEQYRQARLELDSTITRAYAELYYLKRSIEITRDRIHLMQSAEHVARTRYTSGSSMAPILQAQVELGRLEDRLSALKDQRNPRNAQLNTALNQPADTPLPWPEHLPYQPVQTDAAILSKQLPRTSPQLSALEHRIRKEEHNVTLAKKSRLPDITLGVQYIQTDDADMPVADSGNDPVIGTIGITLPIWPGKNHSRIQSALAGKTAAALQLENHQKTLEARIQQTLFQLRDADRKIDLYRDSLIPKARQSLEISRKDYEAGTLEFINLIDAERMLLEFELSFERALADHLIQRAELSQLTGQDFLTPATGENHEN